MSRALIALNAQVVALMQQLANKQSRNGTVRPYAKMPEPAPFKSDPEDFERFLRQLTNTFSLDPTYFRDDLIKIKYTSNLLSHSDKWTSPSKWYESYHLKIDEDAARRMPGYRSGPMDPVWKTWPRFVDSLRSSFSNRISRQQAVQQWEDLRHTNSIDDFLDELVRLQ